MRRTLGTAVFAGMLGVTLFGIFLTPVFFYVIQWFNDLRQRRAEAKERLCLVGCAPICPTACSGDYAPIGYGPAGGGWRKRLPGTLTCAAKESAHGLR